MSFSRRVSMFLVLLACSVAFTSVSVGESREEKARKIRQSGIAAFEAGEFSKAKSLFDAAVALSSSSTSLLWSARARVRLGMMVEAVDYYRSATRPTLSSADAAEERESRKTAGTELYALDRRIPRLRIFLDKTSAPEEVDVTVDGKPIERELLKRDATGPFRKGRAMKLNPGRHVVVGIKGEHRYEEPVTLREGQKREVRLRFPHPDTVKKKKCRDACERDCGGRNQCYLECKRHCFTKDNK